MDGADSSSPEEKEEASESEEWSKNFFFDLVAMGDAEGASVFRLRRATTVRLPPASSTFMREP